MTNRRRLVRVIVISAVTVAGVLCIVVVPMAIQARREAASHANTVQNLKLIKVALDKSEESEKRAPAATVATEAAEAVRLPFDTYSGYFVSNQFEPDSAESFAVIAAQEQFDNTFGVATVMGDKSHRLAKNVFESNVVLAAIKRGGEMWEFKVETVTVNNGVVALRYTTTSETSDSATFACPLIVSIPKGQYTAVRFIENGKVVKEWERQEAADRGNASNVGE